MSAPDITVVVMTFDEAQTLERTVAEIRGELQRLGRPFEILIVDDGSRDGSGAVADTLAAADPSVRVIHHSINKGLGGVYRSGFTEACGDLVTFFPADGQFPASIIPEFRTAIEGTDMVLGLLPPRRDSMVGHFLSTVEKALYRVLVGKMPPFQGVLLIRRRLLTGMELRSEGRGWGILMEFLLRAQRSGARFVNRTTTLRPRAVGRSKVNNVRTIVANMRQLLTLRALLRDHPSRPLSPGTSDA